ncbi:MAG TPA: trigger factor [Thermoanaerobaculia bacterium]|nr:trigger factor [Thermoanaerobaculia bacterium]HUM29055.1 trigger factor [Thermoanaerobaculia bacterium]HXK67389.1 trigger factor [Thermoanaerobaculia bacterium]
MKTSLENQSSSSGTLRVQFTADDVRPLLSKTMKTLKKSVSIPGFRRGKVPETLLLNRFRDSVEEELVHEILHESLHEAEKENDLDLITHPHVESKTIESDFSGEIVVHLHLYPSIDLPEMDGVELPSMDVTVEDEEVQASLEELRESRARLIPVDGSCGKDNFCVVDLFRTVDGEEEESVGKRLLSPTGNDPVPELENSNPGDEVTFAKDYPKEEGGPLAGKRVSYRAVVQEIKTRELPDIDETFATELMGEPTTVEGFREKIAENLKNHKHHERLAETRRSIIDQLLTRVSVEVPPILLEDEMNRELRMTLSRLARQGVSLDGVNVEGMKKELEPRAIRKLQEELLLRRMAREWKISVDDSEVIKAIKEESGPNEDLAVLVKRLRKDGQFETIRYHLSLEKTYDSLYKRLTEEDDAGSDRS